MDMSVTAAWLGRMPGRLWVEMSSYLVAAVTPLMQITFWFVALLVPVCAVLALVILPLSRRNRIRARRAEGGQEASELQTTAFDRRAQHLSIALIALICVLPVTAAIQGAGLGMPVFVVYMALFDLLAGALVVTLGAVALDIIGQGRVAGRGTVVACLLGTVGVMNVGWAAYAGAWAMAYANRSW